MSNSIQDMELKFIDDRFPGKLAGKTVADKFNRGAVSA